MKLHPRLSRAAVELVVRFETFHAVARPAAGGGWTIGYGHTRAAREGARLSREDGEVLLLYDLAAAAEVVEASLFAPVSQRQFEALTAFCFNIGAENFLSSSALARMNAGADLQAADEIECWRRAELGAGAQIVDALVRRRAAEKAHFLGLPEGFSKSPRAVLRPLPGADGQGWETPPPPVEAAPASATLNAVNSVQARLRELVPDPGTPPFPAPDAPPAPPDTAKAAQKADLEPGPSEGASPKEPAAPAPAVVQPYAEPAPPAKPPASPPRGLAAYVAPPPPPPAPNLAARAANDAAPPADRPPPPSATSETAPAMKATAAISPPGTQRDAARPPKLTARQVYSVLAAFGACLFVAAAALILGGRPTLANLVLGVCGVGLMTPGVYGLLGPRPPER